MHHDEDLYIPLSNIQNDSEEYFIENIWTYM